uniref:Uncharacterized protein n=1 Tax=Lepeophtheirus salmonis TaxID=72036 RepID=A0A0K2TKH0_LEPSM
MHPKGVPNGLASALHVGAKSLKNRVLQLRRFVSFIDGVKDGLSTLTTLIPSIFLIALWTVRGEPPRSLAWGHHGLDGIGLGCFL